MGAQDTTVDGHPLGRMFIYEYQLSGGRIETTAESAETSGSAREQQQFEQQLEEARLQGRREVTKVIDTDLESKPLYRT